MAHLFIGGVADGERRRVPDDQWSVRINFIPPTGLKDRAAEIWDSDNVAEADAPLVESHTYRRRTLDHSGLSVFALHEISPLDMMLALVKNYNPKGE